MRAQSGEPTLPVCFVWARVFAAVYADLDFSQSRGAWLILRIKCVIGVNQKRILSLLVL